MTRTHTKYHTSPEGIKEPNEQGRFGKGIFFSNQPYYMTQSENPSLYSLDINEDDVIEDFDYEDAAEGEYDLQKLAGEAAELLGFKGVNLKDETGTSTLMNIFHALPNMRKIK